MQDTALVQKLASILYEHKARDIVALNVQGLTVLCDWMLICSGRNVNQVQALARDLDDAAAELGLQLRRSEGGNEGRWIVLDYATVIVHVFHQDDRAYYNLERLWEDGSNRLTLPFDQPDA